MSRLILTDFSGIAHPIFHIEGASPDVNAVSTAIVAKVRALTSGQKYAAICCDSRKSFRKDLEPSYKASRESKPAAFFHQCHLALDILKADGYPIWEADGFEGDDVIATACKLAEANGWEVQIHSSDKDLLALCSERVSVKSPISGNVMDPAAVQEKFGVAPNQMGDYLAIVGDTSDNVVGVKGIGAKGAAALLTTFGTLDDLYTALDKGEASIKPAQLLALNEFKPRLPVVRQLLTLRTDAPIPFDEILRERVPVDVAVFGGEDDMMADINEAMPTLDPKTEAIFERIERSDPTHRELTGAQATDALGAFAADVARRVAPKTIDEKYQEFRAQALQSAPSASQQSPDPVFKSEAKLADEGHGAYMKAQALVVSESLAPVEFERQLEPRSMNQAVQLSTMMFQARVFNAYGTSHAVLSTILAGRELGMSAMASLRAFHILDGKPTLAADALRALVLKSGKAKSFRCTERTPTAAAFVTERHGEEPMTLRYTIEEAQAAGLVKNGSGWTKNPADMLVARASSKLARLVYPDVVAGLYAPEEF